MATALYDKGREGFANGAINWASDDIRVILVNVTGTGTLYTPNLATHDFLDDVTAGARVATSAASLANKTATDGICDADDLTITSVSGAVFEAIIIYKHTGTESTSRLIAFIDNYTGLAYTPSGANITILWPNAASTKIFKL